MITWFQRLFGKHFKWVLLAFLVVLLFSFIVSIGAVPRLSMQGTHGKTDMYFGVDRNDKDEMQRLAGAVQYSAEALYGQQITQEAVLEKEINNRIIELYLADQWHLPDPSPSQLENFLKSLPVFRGADGQFSLDRYQKFKDDVEAGANREAVVATLKEEARLSLVRTLLAGPGYSLPFVINSELALGDVKSDISLATLDYKSFAPTIDLTGDKLEAKLKELYDAAPGNYPIPAKTDLAYVNFPSAAIPAPTAQQLADFIKQHPGEFPDLKPDLLSEKDKADVTITYRKENAAMLATKFAREVLAVQTSANLTQITPTTPQFVALLKKYNLTVQTLPTVTVGTPVPADSPISDDILQQLAQAMNPQQALEPVPTKDGAALVMYVNSQPARASTFAEVHDQVLKAYTDSEKQRQFKEKCASLHDAIAKDMTAGKTFAEAVKAQGFTVKDYPGLSMTDLEKTLNSLPFTDEQNPAPPSTDPLAAIGRDALTVLLGSAPGSTIPNILSQPVGQASTVAGQGNTAIVFFVSQRHPADKALDTTDAQRMSLVMAEQETGVSLSAVMDNLQQSQPAK